MFLSHTPADRALPLVPMLFQIIIPPQVPSLHDQVRHVNIATRRLRVLMDIL